MARHPKASRDQTLSDTRQRLLDAAAGEFANEGYVGANINRISQAAGFAKGTVYNHFDSKRALMLALIDEVAAAHIQMIAGRVESETGALQRLEQFFRAGFDFVEQNPDRARMVINLLYGPDQAFKEHIYRVYEPLFTLLHRGIILVGIEQGAFGPVDPDVSTAMIMTIYLGSCSQLNAAGKIWITPAQIMSFVLDGLRCAPADARGAQDGHHHVFAQG
jgi:AcrR family transcriptional regulator